MAHRWKVVPLSQNQLLDIRPNDVLNNGHFRKCSTYRGGGGYDQFPIIAERRMGKKYSEQFIVQLFGCNLDCPYCYVTRAGVWGNYVEYTTNQLIDAFISSGQQTFHLMGGAPALYLQYWDEMIRQLLAKCPEAIFHSDLMLTEKLYKMKWIESLQWPNVLCAVNIKGLTKEEYMANTRKDMRMNLFWTNLKLLCSNNINFYLTFTNISDANYIDFWRICKEQFGG